MATAIESRDYRNGYGARVREVAGGYEGRRTFRVDSDDPIEVITASGLPDIGDEFPGFPLNGVSCRCYSVDPSVPRGGGPGPDGLGDNIGLTYVEALYRTPSLGGGGGGPSPEPSDPVAGDSYTIITTNISSVEINTDISGTAIKPTQRQVTEISAVVRVYKSAFSWLTEMVRIRDSLNDANVTLPNLGGYNSGINRMFPASTLLAGATRTEIVRPGLVAAEMEFSIAPPRTGGSPAPGEEFAYFYQKEDDDGVPFESIGPLAIYPSKTWDTAVLFGAS